MIEKRKMEIMRNQSKKIDWKEIEDNWVTNWYVVGKIMHTLIPPQFPYFTFEGLIEEIKKDPNYKSEEDGN